MLYEYQEIHKEEKQEILRQASFFRKKEATLGG
jgi:hypothetical protein